MRLRNDARARNQLAHLKRRTHQSRERLMLGSIAPGKILNDRPVEPLQFVSLSSAEAILRYAGDFIPSWAGAVSIDLMPAVLVIILCVAHAGIRREQRKEPASVHSNPEGPHPGAGSERKAARACRRPCRRQ
jgi:hypothetical protein